MVIGVSRFRELELNWLRGTTLAAVLELVAACGGNARGSSPATSGAGGSDAGQGGAGAVASHAGQPATTGAGTSALGVGGDPGGAGAGGSLTPSGGAAGTPPVDPFDGTTEEYWTQFLQTELERDQECFGIPADYVMLASNVVSAHYWVEQEVRRRARAATPSIDAGRVRFDRQLAAECLNRLATQSCEARLLEGQSASSCVDDALIGLIPLGGPCESSIDCAGLDEICYAARSEEPRVCTPRPGPGQSCDFSDCARGNECVQTGPDPLNPPAFTCVPRSPASEGQACNPGSCGEGLYCSNLQCRVYRPDAACSTNADCLYPELCLREPGSAGGHCGRGHAEGEACGGTALDDDCAFSFACRPGPSGQRVCTSVWAPVGEHCSNTGGSGGIVCIDGNCDILDRVTQAGVCVPPDQLGEDCYVGSCAPGLECTQAGCQPQPF